MADATIITAFGAGALSFFSPCVLPLVPAYLSMVSGVSVEEIRAGSTQLAGAGAGAESEDVIVGEKLPFWRLSPTRFRVLRGTALFMFGFTVVFVFLGATSSAVGRFLLDNRTLLQTISGVFVIIFGVFLAGFLRPTVLEQERRFRFSGESGNWGAPLLGVAFAFGWTPCIGPVLGSVLTLASTSGEVGRGMTLLLSYSLGLGIPFLLSGLALSEMSGLFGFVKRHFRVINLMAGTTMVIFGFLLVFDRITWVSGQVTRFLDQIGLESLTSI